MNYHLNHNGNSPKVNPNLGRASLGAFDFDRIARQTGGLISREDIGEILVATRQNEELVDFLLRAWVKNPKRIARSYHGTYCRLLDYRSGAGIPLYVSRVSGSVLSESWGEHRSGGGANGIFDVAAVIFGLMEKNDFPRVYFIVRKAFEVWKRLLASNECTPVPGNHRAAKERLLSYFVPFYSGSIRKAPSAQKLWQALPGNIKEEEPFGGSFRRFREFLVELSEEDPTDGPFRVSRHDYGNNTVFRLSGEGENTSQA